MKRRYGGIYPGTAGEGKSGKQKVANKSIRLRHFLTPLLQHSSLLYFRPTLMRETIH
jgi:hypothetical protein